MVASDWRSFTATSQAGFARMLRCSRLVMVGVMTESIGLKLCRVADMQLCSGESAAAKVCMATF